MIQIYPSILEKDIRIFKKKLQHYFTIFDYFQIDIADGIFVDNKTITINDIILTMEQWNNRAIKPKSFEIHLMVKDWQSEIPKIEKLAQLINIKSILIHLQVYNTQYSILNTKCLKGLVLNPEDDVEKNLLLIKKLPICQIMTIHPGKQGQSFIPETLKKIEQLRNLKYGDKIILDGAINNKTLPLILSQKFLPDAICPGSYFRQNSKKKLKVLTKIIQAEKHKDRI